MINTKHETREYLLKEEARLIKLIDNLAGNKHFGKNMRGKAINTLAVVQSELNRRDAIIARLPKDSFFTC